MKYMPITDPIVISNKTCHFFPFFKLSAYIFFNLALSDRILSESLVRRVLKFNVLSLRILLQLPFPCFKIPFTNSFSNISHRGIKTFPLTAISIILWQLLFF